MLANDVLPAGKVNIADKEVMPATPDVRWTGLREALIREDSGDTDFAVYLNGDLDEEIINPKYSLYEAPVFTAVSASALRDESVWGYAGAPYYYYPDSSFAIVIPFSERGADEELDIDVHSGNDMLLRSVSPDRADRTPSEPAGCIRSGSQRTDQSGYL